MTNSYGNIINLYCIVGFFKVFKFCEFREFDRFMKFKFLKNQTKLEY